MEQTSLFKQPENAYIGTYFIKKKDAVAYAKKGGKRIIYETDNGYLVI